MVSQRGESSKSTLKSSTTSKPGFAATVVKEPKPAQSVKSMFGNVAAANTLKKEKEEAAVAVVDAKLKGKVKVKSEKGDLQSGGKVIRSGSQFPFVAWKIDILHYRNLANESYTPKMRKKRKRNWKNLFHRRKLANLRR